MIKRAPGIGQIVVIAVFTLSCLGLGLYLWNAFGGALPLKPKGYRFSVALPQAQQLADQADVRISGVPVGRVVKISLGADHRTHALVELKRRYAPLRADARAILRAKSLLGETYLELTSGTRGAAAVRDGGQLAPAQVAPSVALDEIYRVFDAPTRRALQVWLQSFANGLTGRGRDLNDALGNLDGLTQDGSRVLALLESQRGAVRALVRNTGVVFDALGERDRQLQGLIRGAGATFAATAASDRRLAEAIRALPGFEAESQLTLRRLDSFAADANPLLNQLRPAARALPPALANLRRLAPDLDALLSALGPLTRVSAAGLPALDRTLLALRPLLAALHPVLRNLNPLVGYGAGYDRELGAFFANTVAATQAHNLISDIPSSSTGLHYLRTTNPLGPEALAVYERRAGANRTNAYPAPGAYAGLSAGLPVFDARGCSNPTPRVTGPPTALVPQHVLDLIAQLRVAPAGSNQTVPAPPCRSQAAAFPQIRALAP
jgi:virulence factor Mce-like protein